jgi:hypothetical protein
VRHELVHWEANYGSNLLASAFKSPRTGCELVVAVDQHDSLGRFLW